MKYYDNHVHTNFSPDSRMIMENAVRKAAENGLGGIAFTDHYDIDAPCGECGFQFDPLLQQKEIDKMRSMYKLDILKGIEVGLQHGSIDKAKAFTGSYNFDTVIASVHFVDGEDPYKGEYYINKNYKQAYSRVLEIIYDTAREYNDFDIIGHFDYIVRYAPHENYCKSITMAEFGDYLEPLLAFLTENGKTLEINTKTYKDKSGYAPVLDINILKRFRELGGEALSLGSDAHEYCCICGQFDIFREIIKNCGFRYLVYYKNRKPQFYKI